MHGNLEKNKRIQNLDIARAFAILCVVLCHCVEAAYSDINYVALSSISQIFRIVFFTVGRLGVPIFLFLTGSLILNKQIETDEDIIKFYKRNLLPLFITIEIWNVVYNLFNWALEGSFSFKVLVKNILFFEQVKIANMWYMPMILGMYIAIPFIAKIVKTFSLKTIIMPMMLVFVSSILLPSINIVLDIFDMEQYKIILDMSFLGGTYGVYILVGYYISNRILKKYHNILFVIIATIFFLITCFIQYWAYSKAIAYNVWYNFATLFMCGACIFELFIRIKNTCNINIFIKTSEYISKISLGIFFIHKIFLNSLVRVTKKLDLSNPIEMIILFALTIILTILFIVIISNIKILKEKLLLIKE